MSPTNREPALPDGGARRIGSADLQLLDASGFEALQELARHGYAPHPQPLPNSTGILLRHKVSADLVLYPDGTIRVPPNQALKGDAPGGPSIRRVSWRRGLLFLFGLIGYTVIAAIIIINLTAN